MWPAEKRKKTKRVPVFARWAREKRPARTRHGSTRSNTHNVSVALKTHTYVLFTHFSDHEWMVEMMLRSASDATFTTKEHFSGIFRRKSDSPRSGLASYDAPSRDRYIILAEHLYLARHWARGHYFVWALHALVIGEDQKQEALGTVICVNVRVFTQCKRDNPESVSRNIGVWVVADEKKHPNTHFQKKT